MSNAMSAAGPSQGAKAPSGGSESPAGPSVGDAAAPGRPKQGTAPSGGSERPAGPSVGDAAAPGRPKQGTAPSGGSERPAGPSVGALFLDAQALYLELLVGVRALYRPGMQLIGVTSGGVWLAERLQRDLSLTEAPGVISSSMHRDDYARRGMTAGAQTKIAFDVNEAHIILLDDVLYTGRTIRAVLNELFDFGRPASVKLAVLVDRGGRELPIQADVCAARVALPANQSLALARGADGVFSFNVETR